MEEKGDIRIIILNFINVPRLIAKEHPRDLSIRIIF